MQKPRERGFLWKYLRDFRFGSLLIRNFALILTLILLPSVIVSLIYGDTLRTVSRSEAAQANQVALRQDAHAVDALVKQAKYLGYSLAFHQDVQSFLYSAADSAPSSGVLARLYAQLEFIKVTHAYVDSIAIYSAVNERVLDENQMTSIREVADLSWLSARLREGNDFTLFARRKNGWYPYLITLVCPIRTSRFNASGAVVVNLNAESLFSYIGAAVDPAQVLYLLGANREIFFTSDQALFEQCEVLPTERAGLCETPENDTRFLWLDSQGCFVSRVFSESFAWDYFLVSPSSVYEDTLAHLNHTMRRMMLVAAAASLITAAFVSMRSYSPISALARSLEARIPLGESPRKTENNELEYIIHMVDNSQRENRFLHSQLEQRLSALNRAQMLMLQSQINPHFLYNTLDAIRWMEIRRDGRENEVSRAISDLARLLRISLQRDDYLVSVEEEIRHAELYLKLLKQRYPDELRVEWDIAPDIGSCRMPKLSLQPLIENSLRHGLQPRHYHGSLSIRGWSEEGLVILTIEDDGVGMAAEDVEELNRRLALSGLDDDPHVGIRNVNQRIHLLYGAKYGVTVASNGREAGFKVTLRFPVNVKQGA